MKNREDFNRLVNQLSGEAEQEKLAEAQVARRRKILVRIARAFSWVILAAGLAAGYAYREDIGQVTAKITGKSDPKSSSSTDRNAKVQKVMKDVQKYMEVADEAGK